MIDPDGLAVSLDRLGRQAGALQHDTVVELIDRITWVGGTGLSQPPDGFFRVASPIDQETQTMQGIRLRRCAIQHQTIRSFGLIEPTGLMMNLRLAQERR